MELVPQLHGEELFGNIVHIMLLHLEFISILFDEYKSGSVNYETCEVLLLRI